MPTFKHRKIVLKETKTHQYLLLPSTKEEVAKAEELFHKRVWEILDDAEKDLFPLLPYLNMCGKVSEINSTSYVTDLIHKIDDGHYKCYCGEEADYRHNLILHEDSLSAFKCACYNLQAEYFIVLYVKKDLEVEGFRNEIAELEKAKIKLRQDGRDNLSDTNRDTEVREENTNE